MVILTQNNSLAQGISQAGSALGQALGQRGQRAYNIQERLAENQRLQELDTQKRERLENQQVQQLGALQQAFANIDQSGSESEQFSTLLGALKDAGVPMDPNTALNFYKTFGDISQKKAKEAQRSPEERAAFKENQKIVAGISADAKTASNLLKSAGSIEKAINSGNISGPGLTGNISRVSRWLTGKGPPPEEQILDTERKNAILAMGDLKGIRITDAKLRFLEESLFNPNKSIEQNKEAFRIYKDALEQRVKYLDSAKKLTSSDPNALYDPTFSIRLQESLSPTGQEDVSATETFSPTGFADLVRQRRGKK